MGCTASSKAVHTVQMVADKKETDLYAKIDVHARNTPDSVKGSIEDVVNYLSIPSKNPKMLARAFFVWMSENIKYDADGYFGTSQRTPCDSQSVIKSGKSVCAGYANVMEAFCRQAKINVKNISGYAKGFSHSPDKGFTTDEKTNHAWNAVQLDGKWYLIDATWGAGHLNKQHKFEKCFNEIFYLTDPKMFISSHFPYIDGDMASSMEWQLLESPVSLEKFNKSIRRRPASFKLDVQPLSHENGYVEVTENLEMIFKIAGTLDAECCASLKLYDGNCVREIKNTAIGQREGNKYIIRICPPKAGKYNFTLFGREVGEKGKLTSLFIYLLNCNRSEETDFRYPETYSKSQRDRCILHEPMKNNLPPYSNVRVSLSSPLLLRVMINQCFLNKTGDRFEGIVTTGAPGTKLSVFGSRKSQGTLGGLYVFDIKQLENMYS